MSDGISEMFDRLDEELRIKQATEAKKKPHPDVQEILKELNNFVEDMKERFNLV